MSDSHSLVSTSQVARCLQVLRQAEGPMTAAEIAAQVGFGGGHETQRRKVRAAVRMLRADGARIVATLQQGYWLTDDDAMWRDYLDGRAIDAKRIIGESCRRKKMLTDGKGQGLLFDCSVAAGCAKVMVV